MCVLRTNITDYELQNILFCWIWNCVLCRVELVWSLCFQTNPK